MTEEASVAARRYYLIDSIYGTYRAYTDEHLQTIAQALDEKSALIGWTVKTEQVTTT